MKTLYKKQLPVIDIKEGRKILSAPKTTNVNVTWQKMNITPGLGSSY